MRTHLKKKLLLLVFIFFPCGAAFADVQVVLRPQVLLKQRDVTLNDVAELSSDDLNSLLKLRSVNLGMLPENTTEIVIEKERIRRWVIQKLGSIATRAIWTGATKVSIQRISNIDVVAKNGVVRDAWVTLRVSSGLVTVDSKAMALQSGTIGQYVRVKKVNLSSSLLAKVVDYNLVEITE